MRGWQLVPQGSRWNKIILFLLEYLILKNVYGKLDYA
jgi:hypothetical protein